MVIIWETGGQKQLLLHVYRVLSQDVWQLGGTHLLPCVFELRFMRGAHIHNSDHDPGSCDWLTTELARDLYSIVVEGEGGSGITQAGTGWPLEWY